MDSILPGTSAMPVCLPALYALPAVKGLLVDERAALMRELSGLSGAHGLLLAATGMDLPRTPMLRHWARLDTAPGRLWRGDVRARQDEPLPFADDSMRVVLLAHALEQVSHPHALLDEVRRVLAGDGLLLITGFHPLSLWSPWLAWAARRDAVPAWRMPAHWRFRLAAMGLRVYASRRFGGIWPGARDRGLSAQCGGGYVLLARKQSNVVTPLSARRLRAAPAATTVSWAPGAQRERA